MNIKTNLLMMLRLGLIDEDKSKVKRKKQAVIKEEEERSIQIFCLETELKIYLYIQAGM